MWLFTPDYFVSAVVDRDTPDLIHLRARRREHLVALLERHPWLAARCPTIRATPRADYAFRVRLQREEWATIVAEEALAMDQTNYKSAAARRGFGDAASTRALHQVWAAMYELQGRATYSVDDHPGNQQLPRAAQARSGRRAGHPRGQRT